MDESASLSKLEDETTEEITEKTYGALKASCERVVKKYFPDNSLIIRPGLIVGPRDTTKRFSYWPMRIMEAGEVLAPGSPNQKLQFIDVRDLAKWIVKMVEDQKTGFYNATGPNNPLRLEELIDACSKLSQKEVKITWVDEDFLIKHQVQDWVDLPLWLSQKRDMPGFFNINSEKAILAGLRFRLLSATLSGIIDWERHNQAENTPMGLDRTKEQDLLKIWKDLLLKSNGMPKTTSE